MYSTVIHCAVPLFFISPDIPYSILAGIGGN